MDSRSLGKGLLLICFFLVGMGLVAIYAASALKADDLVGDPLLFFRKQLLSAGLGIVVIITVAYMPIRLFERLALPLFCVTLLLLCLVLVPGIAHSVGGASRWIRIAGFGFQPSELAKLALVFFLAKNLSRPVCDATRFRSTLLPNLGFLTLFVLMLMLQPDLGTSILLALVCIAMLFAAGMPYRYLWGLALAGIGAIVVAVLSAPYRFKRLVAFVDPWSNLQTSGFQIIQSYLAFQNGGVLGAGLGGSKQKLFFLPEAHTDFILSVIGEELGLLGVSFVCCAFAYIAYAGYRICCAQTTSFRKFLVFGLTCLITFQSLINMGVTMGILPTKGIPLPFISSGSTALLTFLFAAGVLYRLAQETGEI